MNLERIKHPASSAKTMEGQPVEIGGWTFQLRPLSNRNRYAMSFYANHPEAVDKKGAMADPDLLAQFLAECFVLDWSGAELEDGTAIPFSKETAREIFALHPALAQDVFEKAIDLGTSSALQPSDADLLGNLRAGGVNGASTPAN